MTRSHLLILTIKIATAVSTALCFSNIAVGIGEDEILLDEVGPTKMSQAAP